MGGSLGVRVSEIAAAGADARDATFVESKTDDDRNCAAQRENVSRERLELYAIARLGRDGTSVDRDAIVHQLMEARDSGDCGFYDVIEGSQLGSRAGDLSARGRCT